MFYGLLFHRIIRSYNQQCKINPCCTSEHISNELLMPRNIDDPEVSKFLYTSDC